MRMRQVTFNSCIASLGCAVVAAGVMTANLLGYTTVGHTWGTAQVIYYVNPANVSGMSSSEVSAAVQRAAAPWTTQSGANIQLVYGGTTSGGSLSLNNRNEVFFRNDGSSYAGETYWWYDHTGRLVDFDIVLHEGSYRFYGSGGCSSGIYLDNLLVHEFGHGLGLGHSDSPGVTMAASMPGYCDTSQMTLEQDDINGIRSLYPGGTTAPQPPAAPTQLAVTASSTSPTSALIVSWSDQSNNENGFAVERSLDGYSFGEIAQVATNVRT
jgi:hypothetical protein